jgi:hypothetical protein
MEELRYLAIEFPVVGGISHSFAFCGVELPDFVDVIHSKVWGDIRLIHRLRPFLTPVYHEKSGDRKHNCDKAFVCAWQQNRAASTSSHRTGECLSGFTPDEEKLLNKFHNAFGEIREDDSSFLQTLFN